MLSNSKECRTRQVGKRRFAAAPAVCLAVAMLLLLSACGYQSPAETVAFVQSAPAVTQQTLSTAALPSISPILAASPAAPALTPASAVQPSPTPHATKALKPAPKATVKPTVKPTPKPTPKPVMKKTACPTAKRAAATAAPVSGGLKAKESAMIALVNSERAQAGLKPLSYDSGLRAAALKHSQDMLENNYFDHTSPVYGTFQQRLNASGVKNCTAGENIAYYPSMEQAHVGLMNSPGHRANILNSGFTRIGIGIVYDKDKGMYYITQWFAG